MHFNDRRIREVRVVETNTTHYFYEGIPVYDAKTMQPLTGCIVMDDDDMNNYNTIDVKSEVVK